METEDRLSRNLDDRDFTGEINTMVPDHTGIRNIVVLILPVAYFASVLFWRQAEAQNAHGEYMSRLKTVLMNPTFFNYAMTHGLYDLLFPNKAKIKGGT